MGEIKKLNTEDLNEVVGGVWRTVNTNSSGNAVIFSGPDVSYMKVTTLKNGCSVNTTGDIVENSDDGRTWYEIDDPVNGWIAGSLIGY